MLYDYLPSIIALTGIQLIGLISPGPDFAVVIRNSLIYSRKTGVVTAVGVAFGILVHLTYILCGLGLLISQTIWLFHIFKFLGAGYLITIGIMGMRAKKVPIAYDDGRHRKDIPTLIALRNGFLTNALNPKAMLFFLSLISAFVTPEVPGSIIFTYGVIIFASTLIWFTIVSLCFSHKKLRIFFSNIHHWVERVTGGLLTLLGIKILFTEAGSTS